MKFKEFKLPEKLQGILASLKYETATKVQEESIPLIMEGRDILASSQTGTGKTGAFLIPFISLMEKYKNKDVLIITPTRELAKQIYTVANQMIGANNREGACGLLIGGEDINRQMRQLKRRPRIIIGTPGRINDHLKRRTLSLKNTYYLVLDETDRMLDMGFGIQIDEVLKFLPQERQTVLFSATLPKSIIKLSEKYLKNPARIAVGNMNSIVENIKQNIIYTEKKFEVLIEEIEKTVGSILIFVRTQRNADAMKEKLADKPYVTDVLHGGLRQSKRTSVMSAFRGKRCNVLVATDVASRGLDVSHIEHVINYDMPDNPEDYIHRVGRTARAGKTGIATSLVSKADKPKLHAIERFLKGDEEGMEKQRSSSRNNRSSQGRSSQGRSSQERPRRERSFKDDRQYRGRSSQDASSNQERPYRERKFNDNSFHERAPRDGSFPERRERSRFVKGENDRSSNQQERPYRGNRFNNNSSQKRFSQNSSFLERRKKSRSRYGKEESDKNFN